MLSQPAVVDLVKKDLYPAWEKERDRLERIDCWYRWRQEDLKLPKKATPELKALAELSKTPWLGLVVTTVAQCLFVDGFRSALDEPADPNVLDEPVGPWRTWRANAFDHRQTAVHRGALAYGYSFVTVLPGDSASVMRGVSPRKMHAVYDDPAEDDWPKYAMHATKASGRAYRLRVFDDQWVYHLTATPEGEVAYHRGEEQRHDAGVCPVVRYCNMLDLDGRSSGEVEPFIPAAARINKTAFDRLVTQHFSSWKVRTVTGMAEPDDQDEANRKALQLRQEDLLVAEDPDTKFGTLDATDLRPFVEAWRADIEALAAVTQTPAHALTGQLVNLSAEALAAAQASLTQKVTERQHSFGKSHAQALRLAAALEGDKPHAEDMTSRVTWQDMSIRSMSQAVDALGKASTLLGIPGPALWSRIPGVEKSDVDEWQRMAAQMDPLERMQADLERQAVPSLPDA